MLENINFTEIQTLVAAGLSALITSGGLGAIIFMLIKSSVGKLLRKTEARISATPIASEIVEKISKKEIVVQITPIVESYIRQYLNEFADSIKKHLADKYDLKMEEVARKEDVIATGLAVIMQAFSDSKAYSIEERLALKELSLKLNALVEEPLEKVQPSANITIETEVKDMVRALEPTLANDLKRKVNLRG